MNARIGGHGRRGPRTGRRPRAWLACLMLTLNLAAAAAIALPGAEPQHLALGMPLLSIMLVALA